MLKSESQPSIHAHSQQSQTTSQQPPLPHTYSHSRNSYHHKTHQPHLLHIQLNRYESEKQFNSFQRVEAPPRVASPEEFLRIPRDTSSNGVKHSMKMRRPGSKAGINPLKVTSSTNTTEGLKLSKGRSTPTFLKNHLKSKGKILGEGGLGKESFYLLKRLG